MAANDRLDELVAAVQSGARYAQIDPGLVGRIGTQELEKGRSFKEAVKATRTRLHQVAGAYQETPPAYSQLAAELAGLPDSWQDPALRSFCLKAMSLHTSTRERLPYLAEFYRKISDRIGPLSSVLDLACGLNPLALPWMGAAEDVTYHAVDIYADLATFLGQFFNHLGLRGVAERHDLTLSVPQRPVQLALLLKTLPCLDQLDKTCGIRLIEGVRAEHLVVSFPARSLGGKQKGMLQNYSARFEQLVAGHDWKIEKWLVGQELVYWLTVK